MFLIPQFGILGLIQQEVTNSYQWIQRNKILTGRYPSISYIHPNPTLGKGAGARHQSIAERHRDRQDTHDYLEKSCVWEEDEEPAIQTPSRKTRGNSATNCATAQPADVLIMKQPETVYNLFLTRHPE